MTENVNPQVANVENNVSNQETAAPAKKRRRGLGEVRGASRKKFSEQDCNRSNGLFTGHLDTVELTYATQKEDSQLTSFAGLAVPSLVFTFASNHEIVDDRRYATLRISPCESNAETIPGGKEEWKFNQPMAWLKHILDVFVLRGKAMTEEMEDKLALPFEDFDENGEYVPVEAEVVLNGWRILFENFLAILENNGKPYYKNDKGGILPIWIKLLRYTKQKNKNTKELAWAYVATGNQAGDLAFTPFVNEGAIELFNQSKAPNLRVDASKESITHKEVPTKAKTPNMPNIPGVGGGVTPIIGVPGMPAMPTNEGLSEFNPNPVNYGSPVGSDDLPF